MDYDPFVRGPFPVGVRSGQVVDARRGDRRLPFEVWYPAAPRFGGLDLAPPTQDAFTLLPNAPALRQAAVRDVAAQAGSHPLILYSHSSLGHRREATFLCTHLASHGYVVAAPDHTGNTFGELVRRAASGETLTQEARAALIEKIIADRVPDLQVLLSEMLGGAAAEVAEQIDGRRLGLIGWSFGGWAVLAAPENDDRFGAIVALAPGGSSQPLPGVIPATLTFGWRRQAPTLLLAAGRDRFTPLPGIRELFERVPSRKQMFVLRDADHDHFGDHLEVELCSRHHAHLFTRGLALAHMDAALKDGQGAQRFLADDPAAVLRERGVDALAPGGGVAGTVT